MLKCSTLFVNVGCFALFRAVTLVVYVCFVVGVCQCGCPSDVLIFSLLRRAVEVKLAAVNWCVRVGVCGVLP